MQEDKHWSQYFTQKLTNQVKLVGPTISCEQLKAPEGAVLEQLPPRVQFTAVATDQVRCPVRRAVSTKCGPWLCEQYVSVPL